MRSWVGTFLICFVLVAAIVALPLALGADRAAGPSADRCPALRCPALRQLHPTTDPASPGCPRGTTGHCPYLDRDAGRGCPYRPGTAARAMDRV